MVTRPSLSSEPAPQPNIVAASAATPARATRRRPGEKRCILIVDLLCWSPGGQRSRLNGVSARPSAGHGLPVAGGGAARGPDRQAWLQLDLVDGRRDALLDASQQDLGGELAHLGLRRGDGGE